GLPEAASSTRGDGVKGDHQGVNSPSPQYICRAVRAEQRAPTGTNNDGDLRGDEVAPCWFVSVGLLQRNLIAGSVPVPFRPLAEVNLFLCRLEFAKGLLIRDPDGHALAVVQP